MSELLGLGFSLNESRALKILLKHPGESLTGYRVGLEGDIPRAASYPALRRLVDKGVAKEDDLGGFYALPVTMVLGILRRRFEESLDLFQAEVAHHARLQ